MRFRSALRSLSLVAVGLALAAPLAHAQPWGARPLRLVAPVPPGAGLDVTLRLIADRLHAVHGGTAIVENKPGADGIVAAQFVLGSPADGATLLAGSPAQMTINPVLREKLAYDPRDFAPVTLVSRVPLVLVVPPALGVTTLREFVALAQRKPRELYYGSASSTFLFATELFARRAGVELAHVPYNGGPPVVQALLAGDVQAALINLPPVQAHLASGRLRALAVTGATRDPLLPDVPTLAEAGVAGYEFSVWVGLFAPAATPPETIARLNAAIAGALASPEVRDKLVAIGITPEVSTPEALAELIRKERTSVESVARAAGIKAQ
jgi:tripartite-type tricarboxylate transporter receptor subunit TctC